MVRAIADSLADVRARIEAAAGRAGRAASSVSLMAVTKGFPREVVETAMAVGISLFGENRVQEAEEKYTGLPGNWTLHLIGHLQRNKARSASGLFSCVQSIDAAETARALESRCAERGKTMEVLVELNTSGEASKAGFRSRENLLDALGEIAALPHLRVRGLMTVGPLTEDERDVRASFAALRSLFDDIRGRGSTAGFDILSMGMSGDFEVAIEEGATLVRLGTALFGQRGRA